jgi:hypothetical protein
LPAACLKAHLGKLRGFPGACITRDDYGIVLHNGFYDFIPVGNDGKFVRVFYFAGFVHAQSVLQKNFFYK